MLQFQGSESGFQKVAVLVDRPALGAVPNVRAGDLGHHFCELSLGVPDERLLGCLADLGLLSAWWKSQSGTRMGDGRCPSN
jgi:hypothetical protein